jgi:hypothetical protein
MRDKWPTQMLAAIRHLGSPVGVVRQFVRGRALRRLGRQAVAHAVPGFRLMIMRGTLLTLAALLLIGCHESGTWNDDGGNWKRIFRVNKPADITVVHSWFWRSPHFTYEYEYYIQVQKHADLQKRLLTMNPMKQLTEEGELQKAAAWSQNRPTWFIPKPITNYQVWVYSNAPNSDFRLLLDRETGDLFLSDRQL